MSYFHTIYPRLESRMVSLIIYGATGYTGRMASEHAKSIGLDFAPAGRSEQAAESPGSSIST